VIGVPLAATSAVRKSQAAASAGNTSAALADAREASRLEPGAATPELQVALVLEVRGDITAGAAAARQATIDEPANWQTWLVRSRLEDEAGHPVASVEAYRRARSLNPHSPLFHQ
jgi:Tfp pilus assembly protein PilF